MTQVVKDLLDYAAVRNERRPALLVAQAEQPTLVLGGHQAPDVLAWGRLGAIPIRRRRGGGGLVLLRPEDVWVDWWLPSDSPRWSSDLRESSIEVGRRWCSVLQSRTAGEVTVHEGALEGASEFRVACFAGRGPGEVFVDGRKAVGITQWRVREGSLVSSALSAGDSALLVGALADPPPGLLAALDHHTTASLGLDDPASLIDDLAGLDGPWSVRRLRLSG